MTMPLRRSRRPAKPAEQLWPTLSTTPTATGGLIRSRAMSSVDRSDWAKVVASFAAFFEGLGTVAVDSDTASFAAPEAGTGLVLGADGTSESFMPLHGMSARWETVTFDTVERTVTLSGNGFAYTYRVPPALGSR